MPRKSKDKDVKKSAKSTVKEIADTIKKAVAKSSTSKKAKSTSSKSKTTKAKKSASATAKNNTTKKSTSKSKKDSKLLDLEKVIDSKKIDKEELTAEDTAGKTIAEIDGLKSGKKVYGLNKSEYYDLPLKYNKTVVKLLAQTPKTLFVYWEISDDDIKRFKEQYGDNFFESTRPVLIVHNDTLNYSFEVPINDFANSWYLHVNDSKSDYRIELGRRPIENYQPPVVQYNSQTVDSTEYAENEVKSEENEELKENKGAKPVEQKPNYIYITSSNEIESPNDHILFEKEQKMVYFRNVKTNVENAVPITSLSFIQNMGKIYELQNIYEKLYVNKEYLKKLSNPSSHTSSNFR